MGYARASYVYSSVMLLSYSISSGASESRADLLLSYSININIIECNHHTNNNHKPTDQLIQVCASAGLA